MNVDVAIGFLHKMADGIPGPMEQARIRGRQADPVVRASSRQDASIAAARQNPSQAMQFTLASFRPQPAPVQPRTVPGIKTAPGTSLNSANSPWAAQYEAQKAQQAALLGHAGTPPTGLPGNGMTPRPEGLRQVGSNTAAGRIDTMLAQHDVGQWHRPMGSPAPVQQASQSIHGMAQGQRQNPAQQAPVGMPSPSAMDAWRSKPVGMATTHMARPPVNLSQSPVHAYLQRRG